ncbi:MAG: 30S ribosomal protein S6--L-glutamate ligase [Candidatus Omnitrophica bacterium]|nr:30S ribosomal protein S6--L-glutamate ligase [Candidatus Omnitrophota bacterium]MCA9434347.1 30S ribosomal protein S6--L-glutamate ligase [Candidatus Omnitrophota bacterium]
MKLAILSRSQRSYSTKRLKQAALQRGHKVRVLDTMKFSIGVESESPELYYRGKPLSTYDAVLPRIGQSITFFGCAVVRQFEQMGVYTANESLAIGRSRDKLRSMQVLSRHEIGIPATAFVRDKNDILPAIERVGGAPVIIKLLEGTQGVGVILADTNKIAEAIIQTLHGTNQNVLIQNFVKESKGKDIRAIVVGDKVIGAMRRRAVGDEFRSNVHRGGTVELVELNEEFEKTAIRAAQIMGLRIAGVDMLEAEEGPQILEVNSSPGLEGIERATQKDIAGAIIEDIEHQVLFPDVDLRQRLRLAAGYGVAEFEVHNIPEIEGKPLRDTNLSDQNIQVLHISRPDSVIPNPKGDEVIHTGDHLLCYGELSALRSLVANRDPKKKKKKKKVT